MASSGTIPTDLLRRANVTGLTPCDAAYPWLAGFLGADLVTLDRRPAAAHDALADGAAGPRPARVEVSGALS